MNLRKNEECSDLLYGQLWKVFWCIFEFATRPLSLSGWFGIDLNESILDIIVLAFCLQKHFETEMMVMMVVVVGFLFCQ